MAIVIMAGMEEGARVEGMREQQQEHGLSSIQARRRFMITDILSSVGNSIREEEKDEEEDEERKASSGHGLDMRLLFPVLGGHNRVDAESGEEADEDDGEDGERGECGLILVRKPSKNCPRCGFQIGPTGAKKQKIEN